MSEEHFSERGRSTAFTLNVRYRMETVSSHAPIAGTWLDYGCAEGGYVTGLQEFGAHRVVGVDVEEDRIESAKARGIPDAEFHCLEPPSFRVPFDDSTFDGVLLNEVIEHVESESVTLAEIRRVLRKDGVLAVLAPNRWFPVEGHGIKVGDRLSPMPAPLIPWLPIRLTHSLMRARNYWPHELRDLVAQAGFRIEAVDFVLPVLEQYPWAPKRLVQTYQSRLMRIHKLRLIRHFGVSTVIIARR